MCISCVQANMNRIKYCEVLTSNSNMTILLIHRLIGNDDGVISNLNSVHIMLVSFTESNLTATITEFHKYNGPQLG